MFAARFSSSHFLSKYPACRTDKVYPLYLTLYHQCPQTTEQINLTILKKFIEMQLCSRQIFFRSILVESTQAVYYPQSLKIFISLLLNIKM